MKTVKVLSRAIPVFLFVLALATLFRPVPANAHFGMIIPSEPTVMETADADLTLEVKFWHPFENLGLNLVLPKSFKAIFDGKETDLLSSLKEVKVGDFSTYSLAYKAERPGLNVFLMEPNPYWEPAEDKFIIHYTKAYVDAFGDDDGWSEPIEGLKTEIVPLARPGAQYAGNVFGGKVLLDGKPVAGGEVEVEWYPGPDKKGVAPYESMVTQVTLTDDDGNFFFSPPVPGWWGFAALNDADYKLKNDGVDKDVELGAVLWVYFHAFNPAVPAN
jgi:cobalt/nickel transport protein